MSIRNRFTTRDVLGCGPSDLRESIAFMQCDFKKHNSASTVQNCFNNTKKTSHKSLQPMGVLIKRALIFSNSTCDCYSLFLQVPESWLFYLKEFRIPSIIISGSNKFGTVVSQRISSKRSTLTARELFDSDPANASLFFCEVYVARSKTWFAKGCSQRMVSYGTQHGSRDGQHGQLPPPAERQIHSTVSFTPSWTERWHFKFPVSALMRHQKDEVTFCILSSGLLSQS